MIDAILFVLENWYCHKEYLPITGARINLKWLAEKWQKLGTGQRSGPVMEVNRKYFELCVLTEAMQDLQSGDLYVANSDQYSDYRVQLVDWDIYEIQVTEYGAMLDLPRNPKQFVDHLKT